MSDICESLYSPKIEMYFQITQASVDLVVILSIIWWITRQHRLALAGDPHAAESALLPVYHTIIKVHPVDRLVRREQNLLLTHTHTHFTKL